MRIKEWLHATLRVFGDRPIVLFWAIVFCGDVALNWMMGYEIFGALMAFMFAAIAVLGAYGAHAQEQEKGGRRAMLIVFASVGVALGIWSGWQQMGLRIDRAMGALSTQASQHNTSADALKAAREERAKLGAQRPVGAIEADLALEERKTSKNCPDGRCGNWTKLKAELETAKRAGVLDAKLPDLVKALEGGSTLRDEDAPFRPIMTIAAAVGSVALQRPVVVTAGDVVFAFEIFAVICIAGFGILGPWALRIAHPKVAPRPEYPFLEAFDFGPKQLGRSNAENHSEFGAASNVLPGVPGGGYTGPQRGDDGLNRPSQPPAASAPASAQSTMHGAPVNVHFHAGSAPAVTPLVPITTSVVDKQADDNVAVLRSVPQRLQITRNDPPAPAAPDAPSDRSAAMAMLDSFVVFRAACIADQPGAWIDATRVYDAYVDWAGARAQSAAAFHSMFPPMTGLQLHHIAGEPKYSGIALKSDLLEQVRA